MYGTSGFSLRLTLILGTWLERDAVGELFVAPFDVVFSAFDVVELDLLYLSNARATGILNEKHLTGAPDIAIQIASRGTRKRDETIKKRLYERSGVAEYWVVDPHRDVIRVYSRGESAYGRAREWSAEAGDVLTTAQLPGLEIPLARVFAAHKLP